MNTELTYNGVLVAIYQPMLCHIPEEQRPQLHCIVGLKFCIVQVVNFQSPHFPALLNFCLVVTIYTFLNYVYCAHLYKEASISFILNKILNLNVTAYRQCVIVIVKSDGKECFLKCDGRLPYNNHTALKNFA